MKLEIAFFIAQVEIRQDGVFYLHVLYKQDRLIYTLRVLCNFSFRVQVLSLTLFHGQCKESSLVEHLLSNTFYHE